MTSESKAGSETVRLLKKAEAEVVKDRATWDRGEYSEEGYGRLLETCESILKSLDAERERDKEFTKKLKKRIEGHARELADGYEWVKFDDVALEVDVALSGEGQAGKGEKK